jgi:hypothetical protein
MRPELQNRQRKMDWRFSSWSSSTWFEALSSNPSPTKKKKKKQKQTKTLSNDLKYQNLIQTKKGRREKKIDKEPKIFTCQPCSYSLGYKRQINR